MSRPVEHEIDSDSRRSWGSVPAEVLDFVIAEFEQCGTIPPAALIAERLGMSAPMVTRALRHLVSEGSLSQPHGDRAPYIPLRRPDGTPVRVLLLDSEDIKARSELQRLLDELPQAKREAAEAYLRFLIEQG